MTRTESLRKSFLVDEKGRLIAKQGSMHRPLGSVVGSLNKKSGYVQFKLNNKLEYAHRVVFEIIHGYAPSRVDHINGDKSDNRPCNLRECSSSQNIWNTGLPSTNTSGAKNVHWLPRKRLWQVNIKAHGKYVFRKKFKSFEDAVLASVNQRLIWHGEFANHG